VIPTHEPPLVPHDVEPTGGGVVRALLAAAQEEQAARPRVAPPARHRRAAGSITVPSYRFSILELLSWVHWISFGFQETRLR